MGLILLNLSLGEQMSRHVIQIRTSCPRGTRGPRTNCPGGRAVLRPRVRGDNFRGGHPVL